MNEIELLAPAGSFKKAKKAIMYGADAVYCGTSSLSLRTRADMENTDLIETIKYVHSMGKKVYVTLNIYAWDEKYCIIPKTITKGVRDTIKATILEDISSEYKIDKNQDVKEIIAKLTDEMLEKATNMEFEKAAELRDRIKELEKLVYN